jgi:hypothetical protein
MKLKALLGNVGKLEAIHVHPKYTSSTASTIVEMIMQAIMQQGSRLLSLVSNTVIGRPFGSIPARGFTQGLTRCIRSAHAIRCT